MAPIKTQPAVSRLRPEVCNSSQQKQTRPAGAHQFGRDRGLRKAGIFSVLFDRAKKEADLLFMQTRQVKNKFAPIFSMSFSDDNIGGLLSLPQSQKPDSDQHSDV